MVLSANLGFPRIGLKRELKRALESYWKKEIDEAMLQSVATQLRASHWGMQKDAGIDIIPSNDFSFYDITLDTIAMVGAVPERYPHQIGKVSLTTYFAMARGVQENGLDIPAMEMTKWFDTNYHYIVPEFHAKQEFSLSSNKAIDEFLEAKSLGIYTRPVILGPVTFLLLGKMKDSTESTLSLLPKLIPIYTQLLEGLAQAGAEWVQLDEPALVLDLSEEALAAYRHVYHHFAANIPSLKVCLTTYFGSIAHHLPVISQLPVQALHIDLVRAPEQLDAVLETIAPTDKMLSLGLVDGRNIWINHIRDSLEKVEKTIKTFKTVKPLEEAERVIVAPSCSLLHVPFDLDLEDQLDTELKSWLSFAKQKLVEITTITNGIIHPESIQGVLARNQKAIEMRTTSNKIHNEAVKKRVTTISQSALNRQSPYAARASKQQDFLKLPLLPTTTIGSFPQTQEVRSKRAEMKAGKLTEQAYIEFLKAETKKAIQIQEALGLDVLVDGEFDRNDMVEHFGERLDGFTFTRFGWVQSYGSRCVKPPVIFGDVSRPTPMTVEWSRFAQSLTSKPMKGMLTGPVTILQWSFVRDDQPRSVTCKQIALAIRDEVQDLEKAGIHIIQIDEPAIREGLPLRRQDWEEYLQWAVDSFKLSSAGVKDETQIHTHMCYSEFNDIIQAVARMDADVISIETSRSQMELLDAFLRFKYPNEIGPGVYDIHAPRIPDKEEIKTLLRKALSVLAAEQLWVNPDCGLKTRNWREVELSLEHMVEARNEIREEIKALERQVVNQ